MNRHLVPLALALVLSACAQAPRPAPLPALAPASVAPAPVPPPAVPIPPAPPQGEPGDYLNLPQANVRSLFGTPQFTRQDGTTQIWRYDGAQCRAFFFFYGAKGSETVRHVETLPAGAASAADPLCLSALKNARRPAAVFPP
jgi:hypothetical protein